MFTIPKWVYDWFFPHKANSSPGSGQQLGYRKGLEKGQLGMEFLWEIDGKMGISRQQNGQNVDLLVLNVGNGWVAGGCWDDYY